MKKIYLLIIFVVTFTISINSFADCTPYTVSVINHNIPNIVVLRDTPVGTILWQGDQISASGQVNSCDGGATSNISTNLVGSDTGLVSGNNKIYSTSVPGIGYAISYNSSSYTNAFAWPSQRSITSPQGQGYTLAGTSSSLRIIKTGDITPGTISSGMYGEQSMGGVMWQNISVSTSGTLTVLACSLNSTNVQVPLEDVIASDLTSVGTVEKPKVFDIGLNCDAGARINAKLTGVQNSDTSAAGVLKLTGAGNANVATGVGIQILYNDAPVTLNNNMVLKTSAGGQETFPFTAQYYQTKTAVTAGSANATATLEITYQ